MAHGAGNCKRIAHLINAHACVLRGTGCTIILILILRIGEKQRPQKLSSPKQRIYITCVPSLYHKWLIIENLTGSLRIVLILVLLELPVLLIYINRNFENRKYSCTSVHAVLSTGIRIHLRPFAARSCRRNKVLLSSTKFSTTSTTCRYY